MGEPSSERVRVKRHPERGRYDMETIYEILDEALICHVAFLHDGRPAMLPTLHARIGDTIYLHGAAANAMLSSLGEAGQACIEATIIDALVLGRSAFHHSMNYRSVVIFGQAAVVEDTGEKALASQALVEHIVPGRSKEARMPSASELAATKIVRVVIDEGSAKVRTGFPKDDPQDLASPVWAGLLPLALQPLTPVDDPSLAEGTPVSQSVAGFARGVTG